jgi:tagatose 6-phosphate kinase
LREQNMILCIGTTPAVQRVMVFPKLTIDAVNRAQTTVEGIAGKSINVVKVLKALGEHPVATGFLGGDRGEQVRAELQAQQIEMEFVPVSVRTRQCTTVFDTSTGTHTELVEESQPVTLADYEKLMAIIRRRTKDSRAVVMSGTITPGGPTDLYLQGTRLAHEAGAISVVDAQGAALHQALTAKPGLVKPNRPELAATVGRELKEDAAVLAAMRDLHERGAQRVVVTAGKGPSLAFDGKCFWRITCPRVEAINPIGSGDSFTAGLVWRLLKGDDIGEACRWGSAAGTANALTIMAGDVRVSDVERLAKEVRVEELRA